MASGWRHPATTVWCACASPSDLDEPIGADRALRRRANKVVFTPSGDLVAAYNDGQVRFWHADGSNGAARRSPSTRTVTRCSASRSAPTGNCWPAASATDGVTLVGPRLRQARSELNGQPIEPLDVAFIPDGTAFVSATARGMVTLWNTATGQSIGAAIPRTTPTRCGAWR